MERNDRCFCGSGIKYKKCHYRINGESKLANIYRAYNEYDNACIQKGICNNCRKGCSQCCNDYFFISESEFLQIFFLNYICLFNYLFISSQMSAKPYFIGSTGILPLW